MGNKTTAEVNTAQAAHTPTPWKVERGTNGFCATWKVGHTSERRDVTIADCGAIVNQVYVGSLEPENFRGERENVEHKANAEFIVRAVNSHAELISILRRTLAFEGRLKACDCDGGRLLVADIRRVLSVNEEVKS